MLGPNGNKGCVACLARRLSWNLEPPTAHKTLPCRIVDPFNCFHSLMAHRFVVGKSSDLWGSSLRVPRAARSTLDGDSYHGTVPGVDPGSSGKRSHEDIGSCQHAGGPKAQTSKRSRQALSGSFGLAQQPTPMDSHISLQVSKAITGFARYPHKRPRGLHSGSTRAASTVSANTTCSSSFRSMHSVPMATDVSCSAVIPRAGPGSRSCQVYGASPNLAVHVVASVHREHLLQSRGASMVTSSRSLLGTLRRTTLRSPSSTRSLVQWK